MNSSYRRVLSVLGPATALLALTVFSGCATTDREGRRSLVMHVQGRVGESTEFLGFDAPREDHSYRIVIRDGLESDSDGHVVSSNVP